MNSSQSVTASFVPAPQIITLPFAVGTNVTEMATYDCPSNPNPTVANPCLDLNAHALALGVAQVTTPFTLTVQATEVPPTLLTAAARKAQRPHRTSIAASNLFSRTRRRTTAAALFLCAIRTRNGNCVHYTVFFQTPGTEPDPSCTPARWIGPSRE